MTKPSVAARESALVVPGDGLVVFEVTGGDRLSWLNGLLTCDLSAVGVGSATYGLVVTIKGRVVSDVVVLVDRERVLLLAQASAQTGLADLLERHLMMEDAEFTVAPPFAVFFVHGPRAQIVLDAAKEKGAVGGMLDRTGLGGAVFVASEPVSEVIGAVKGALHRISGAMGDAAAWEVLRLECGVPRFGVDFDTDSYPQEAGLERTAVSFSKGCYLGQEVVCMLAMRGHVKRRLLSFVLDAADVPARGTPLTGSAGADAPPVVVGQITSAIASARLGKVVALGSVKYAQAKVGAVFRVGEARAEAVEPPL